MRTTSSNQRRKRKDKSSGAKHKNNHNSPTQGHINIAPPGISYPSSLKYIIIPKQSPAPALSPAKITFPGGIFKSSVKRRYDTTASLTEPGHRVSGASRLFMA